MALDPQKWLREAEVQHGRICMLAALGYTIVDATFASGLEFCDAVGLRAVAAVAHSYCFSAAPPSLALSWWTWLLGALAACWLRQRGSQICVDR